jgi:hypothetical protein
MNVETEEPVADSEFTEVAEPPNRFAAMSDSDIAENLVNVRNFLEKKRAEFKAETAEFEHDERVLSALAISRITSNRAQQLPHPDYIIELDVTKTKEKRIDVLRRLEGLVPEEELKSALYLNQPPPEWVANLVKLNPIARKYGGEIAKIIAEATPERITGAKIKIKPRPSTKKVEAAPAQLAK